MSCLDDAELLGLLEGSLDPVGMARVDAHVDACDLCRDLVADLIRSTPLVAVDEPGRDEGGPQTPGPAGAPEVSRRYALFGLVGQGGMGRVYRALDRLTGRTVALKRVPLCSPSGPSSRREALAHEFRALSALRHPNVISVLDYGFDAERQPYFTMELLEGASPLLPHAASLPHGAQVDLLVQLLRALGYLHGHGILHRDLKPTNILIAADGRALKVLDFGLSVIREDASDALAAGTVAYMAPELFRGGAPSEASDIYAVGVLAYEMMTGRHPFGAGQRGADLIAAVLDAEPDLAPLPPALRAVLGQALGKSPSRRPDGAAAFQKALADAGAALPPTPARARESHLVAARFTGREQELGVLRRALDEARAGRGSAWLVGGPSGVGKSRLLDELRCQALIDGALAMRGQALVDGGTAYHVWRGVLELLALHVDLSPLEASALGAVLPNLSALIEREVPPLPELTRFRLLRALREVVERPREPVLLLLEDLHWADAESLLLLAQVSSDVRGLPLLVVGSYRDDEAPALPAELPAMQALHLARFDRAGVERLCAAMLGPVGKDEALVDRVTRATGGNTYFVVEALRALAEEPGGLGDFARPGPLERVLAGGMDQVFALRLSRVPAEARPLLRLAAVDGRQLDFDMLSRCVPALDMRVQACVDAGVFEVHDQRVRFRHDQLRERVLSEIDAAEALALHALVAESLEATYPDGGAQAARIAHHHREADRPAQAARHYALAGEDALLRGAPGEAEAMLDQAQALHGRARVAHVEEVRVWRGLVQARFGLGRFAEANEAFHRLCAVAGAPLPASPLELVSAIGRAAAERVAQTASLHRLLSRAPRTEAETAIQRDLLLGLSALEMYVWLARPDLMFLGALRGLNLEEALGARDRTNSHAAMALLLAYTPLRGLVARYIERVAPAIAPGTHAEIANYRIRAIIQLNDGQWAEAAENAARAVACARAYGDEPILMLCLIHLQLAQGELDEHAEVLEIGREMEHLASRTNDARHMALALAAQGFARIRLGDLTEADSLLARAIAILPRDPLSVPEATMLGFAAVCAMQEGERARAESLARQAMGAVRRAHGAMVETRYAIVCALQVFLSADRLDDAEIQPALSDLQRIARMFPLADPHVRLLSGRYEHRRGRPARAAKLLGRGLHAAERLGARFLLAQAHHALGSLAASAEGRRHVPEGARVHFDEAIDLFERLGCPWEAAHSRASRARV